jgi:hypothetical protein
MGKKKDFEWRYQTLISSDKAKLLSYIQNQNLHPFETKTMLIMTALTAYYMPLALYNEGSCSRETLELIFLSGVNAIANHLKFTCTALNINQALVSNVLCAAFGGLETSNIKPEEQLIPNTPSQLPNTNEELDDFDPQIWNLAGITTDSETFYS